MYSREEVLATLRDALVELFEIAPGRITPQAHLYTDLEIDSIDAIDLIDHVRRQTGHKLEADDFRTVRTVDDVVNAILAKQNAAANDPDSRDSSAS